MTKAIVSSVIRASQKGDEHGHIFVADIEKEEFKCVFSLADQDINWAGRGGERGIRGIQVYDDYVFAAINNELLVFDKSFDIRASYACPWVGGIHEIAVDAKEGILYLTSTSYNAIVSFNIKEEKFLNAYHFSKNLDTVSIHDPNTKPGWITRLKIKKGWAVSHINNVQVDITGKVRVSGYYSDRFVSLYNPKDDAVRIPKGTHNPQIIYEKEQPVVIYNHSEKDRVVVGKTSGEVIRDAKAPVLPLGLIVDIPKNEKIAKHPWCRGLAVNNELVLAGSTPAMINVYERDTLQFVKSITMSQDIRYAIHGLTFWPYS
jgi:hypothetical protein